MKTNQLDKLIVALRQTAIELDSADEVVQEALETAENLRDMMCNVHSELKEVSASRKLLANFSNEA